MLKCLVVLAVILAAQNPVPADRGEQQKHPQTNPNTPSPSTPASAPEKTKKEGTAGEKHTDNESKTKKYLKDAFAPANLSNWVLAGLGVIGGIMAGFTLRVIFKQTKILENSVAVAKDSAKAANDQILIMKSKERARISVEILPLDNLEFGTGNNRAILKFSNLGYTPALNVRASGDARAIIFSDPILPPGVRRSMQRFQDLQPAFDPLPLEFADLCLPNVMLATALAVETWAGFIFPEEWYDAILRRPRIAIEVRGIVEYDDVFGDPHKTGFSYDLRISRWGEVTPTGSTTIRPFNFGQWFHTIGSPDNQAT